MMSMKRFATGTEGLIQPLRHPAATGAQWLAFRANLQRSDDITTFEAKIFGRHHIWGDTMAELAQEYGNSKLAIHWMLKKTAAMLGAILGDQE